jgi:hypothetical protein
VHAGGQAVVGLVGTPGGGERAKTANQPHAKQIAHAAQPALWGADKEREPVPIAGDAERRCRMHGGTSPGAPKGNKNALKHGRYTAEAIAVRREVAVLLRAMKALAGLE